MAGKYDKVIPKLVKTHKPNEFQQKLEAIKEEIRANGPLTPEELADLYVTTRLAHADQEAVLKQLTYRKMAIEQLLIESEEREDSGWGNYGASSNMVKTRSGVSISINYEPVGTVQDKEAFRIWCIENGLEKSLQLWPSTMNSITKERLLAGESAPDGVVATAQPKIVARGLKGVSDE